MTTAQSFDEPPVRFGTDAFYRAVGRAFVAMCAVVPLLFAVELLDRLVLADLEVAGGILPRQLSGLDGIAFAPLLHDDFAHLYGNAVVLIPVGTFVLAAGVARAIAVTGVVMLVGGFGTWLTGDPNSTIIGASGVIFGFLGYLLMRGLVEHSWWNVGVSLLIGLLYGWQLVGLLPTDERISWQGHLFGFAGGVLAAVVLRRRRHSIEPVEEPRDEPAPASTVDFPAVERP